MTKINFGGGQTLLLFFLTRTDPLLVRLLCSRRVVTGWSSAPPLFCGRDIERSLEGTPLDGLDKDLNGEIYTHLMFQSCPTLLSAGKGCNPQSLLTLYRIGSVATMQWSKWWNRMLIWFQTKNSFRRYYCSLVFINWQQCMITMIVITRCYDISRPAYFHHDDIYLTWYYDDMTIYDGDMIWCDKIWKWQ